MYMFTPMIRATTFLNWNIYLRRFLRLDPWTVFSWTWLHFRLLSIKAWAFFLTGYFLLPTCFQQR